MEDDRLVGNARTLTDPRQGNPVLARERHRACLSGPFSKTPTITRPRIANDIFEGVTPETVRRIITFARLACAGCYLTANMPRAFAGSAP